MTDITADALDFRAAQAKPSRKTSLRRRLLAGLAASVVLSGLGYGAYDVFIASRHVATDDAYVGAQVAQINSEISGPVQQVMVDDTQEVHKGDVLVVIDPADARLALATAEANYRAALDKARLDLSRTVIRAPMDGIVSQRKAQIGQNVQPGQALMTITPIAQAYVDANFKEGQLDKVRVGQPSELTSDLYGSKIVYHGRVAGIGGGTGSAFAVIPAQNATGNWIKVVQRLPVRIKLDSRELKAHPLRVGLSMTATIDTDAVR